MSSYFYRLLIVSHTVVSLFFLVAVVLYFVHDLVVMDKK